MRQRGSGRAESGEHTVTQVAFSKKTADLALYLTGQASVCWKMVHLQTVSLFAVVS